jgi:hypothetical protein
MRAETNLLVLTLRTRKLGKVFPAVPRQYLLPLEKFFSTSSSEHHYGTLSRLNRDLN